MLSKNPKGNVGNNAGQPKRQGRGRSRAGAQKMAPSSTSSTIARNHPPPAKPPRDRGAALSRARSQAQLYGRYAQQMQNPVNVSAPLVLPDTGAVAVCSRKYQRTVSYNQATLAKLRAVMFPNLFLPGFVSGGGATTVPTSGAGSVEMHGRIETSSDTPTAVKGVLTLKGTTEATTGSLYAVTDLGAVSRMGFTGSINSASSLTVTYSNLDKSGVWASSPAPIMSIWVATAAANWTALHTSAILPEGKDVSYTITIPAGGPFTRIAFGVNGTNGKRTSVGVSYSFTAGQFVTAASKTFAPAFAEQIVDQSISQGRVTHMSMYVRNTTSDLASSGSIVAARVPTDFDLGAYDGDWVLSASTLPDNRYYIGPMKTGAYVFWMPEQQDELQIDNIAAKQRSYQDANYLVVEIPDWVAGASVEITYTWIVEFFTPSQNFEKIVPPPITPEFAVLWHMLSRMPAASCNPDHNEETASWVAQVKEMVKNAYGFYNDHKETIDFIGTALLAAAASA